MLHDRVACALLFIFMWNFACPIVGWNKGQLIQMCAKISNELPSGCKMAGVQTGIEITAQKCI